MFTFIEAHKLDPDFRWIEILAGDSLNGKTEVVRVVIDEAPRMWVGFKQRYMAKQDQRFEPPPAQVHQIEEWFEEACMAQVLARENDGEHDLATLLPTTVINFDYPEKTSFRKSRAARVQMFLDEAMSALRSRDFDRSMQRLEWVMLLDPSNQTGFEMRIVCLRSAKKPAECVPVFEAWIGAWPDLVEPRLGMGELWLHLEQYQRAAEVFTTILDRWGKHVQAMIGLAQALQKLGEDPLPVLRKAYVVNGALTQEMMENDFDFRTRNPAELRPRSLQDIADTSQVPLKRLIDRARKGVLPAHPGEDGGLLRYDDEELARYFEILRCLGLEMGPRAPQSVAPSAAAPEPVQERLFDTRDLDEPQAEDPQPETEQPKPIQPSLFD